MKFRYSLLFIIGLFVAPQASAYPTRLQRFVLKDDTGKVEKVVDLFHDTHVKLNIPSKKKWHINQPEKGELFSLVEKELVTVFRKMNMFAQRSSGISLIWEISNLEIQDVCTDSKTLSKDTVFLLYMGCILSKEFSPQKNFIHFVKADDFRAPIVLDQANAKNYNKLFYWLTILYEVINNIINDEVDPTIKALFSEFPVGVLYRYFNRIRELGDQYYLASIFSKVTIKSDMIIGDLWEETKDGIASLEQEVKEIVRRDSSIKTLADFVDRAPRIKENFASEWLEIITKKVADFELFAKALASDTPHAIVYAGGMHCESIAQHLKDAQFELISDVGCKGKEDVSNLTLSPAALRFILKPTMIGKPVDHIRPFIRNLDLAELPFPFDSKKEEAFIQYLDTYKNMEKKFYLELFNMTRIGDYVTLLHYAVQHGWQKAVAQILQDKSVDVNFADLDGNTPIVTAIKNGYLAIAQMLLERGASLDMTDDIGKLMLNAISKDKSDMVQFLLRNGFPKNLIVTYEGGSLLHYALNNDADTVVDVLLKEGVDPDMQDEDGKTPLMVAIEGGGLMVDEFLRYAKNLNVQDEQGMTALHLAVMNSLYEIVKLLLNAGADFTLQDENGQTALDMAIVSGDVLMVETLLENGVKPVTTISPINNEKIKELLSVSSKGGT